MIRTLTILLAILASCLAAAAQNAAPIQEKSLADIARENKAKAKSAKVVLDEDSKGLRKHDSVLPQIPQDGADNSSDIMKAILEFKKGHTPEQTEQMVRDWYEDYDGEMKQLGADNARIENATPPQVRTQQEYRLAVEQRQLDMQRQKQNGLQMARIQSLFVKLRGLLQRENMNWDWFKIRCGNMNCTY